MLRFRCLSRSLTTISKTEAHADIFCLLFLSYLSIILYRTSESNRIKETYKSKNIFLSRLLQQNESENHNSPLFSARLRLKFYQMLLHIDEFLPRNCHNFIKQLADIFICPSYLLFSFGLFFALCLNKTEYRRLIATSFCPPLSQHLF